MLHRPSILFMIAVLSVAACGGAAATASPELTFALPAATPAATQAAPAATPAGGATSAVAVANFAFAPADLTVAAGTTVTWMNSDGADHTVKSSDGGFASSGTLKTGESYSITFSKAGTFSYVCAVHPSMKGTVVVTP